MESFSLLGIWALAALPLIAVMYVRRRRPKVRRVAGLFIWAEAARASGRLAPKAEKVGMPAAFDLAVAAVLVALAWGVLPVESRSESLFGDGAIVALRILVCGVCVALVATLWKWKGSTSDEHSAPPISRTAR
jgi:hypothetical protein